MPQHKMSFKVNARRTYAEISLNQIRSNFTTLTGLAKNHYESFMGGVAMVKANAYGHGLVEVAQSLSKNKDLYALGVASLDEALTLRGAGISADIMVFSDVSAWDEECASAVMKYNLIPVISNIDDLKTITASSQRNKLRAMPFHLKLNTGMNRLGVNPVEWTEAVRLIKKTAAAKFEGLCTHFSDSETPTANHTRSQLKLFKEAFGLFSESRLISEKTCVHAANSFGVIHESVLQLASFCNVIRPGIGLYGYCGTVGEKLGLKPALKWHVKVLASRYLNQNDLVGYGATYTSEAEENRSEAQAILSVGYGDGLRRGLSNREIVLNMDNQTHCVKVQGRISMDLTSIRLRAKPKTWVTILGEGEWQGRYLAKSLNTNEYEILTGISPRVPRIYR